MEMAENARAGLSGFPPAFCRRSPCPHDFAQQCRRTRACAPRPPWPRRPGRTAPCRSGFACVRITPCVTTPSAVTGAAPSWASKPARRDVATVFVGGRHAARGHRRAACRGVAAEGASASRRVCNSGVRSCVPAAGAVAVRLLGTGRVSEGCSRLLTACRHSGGWASSRLRGRGA
jgi:hypothetical protein